MKIDKWNLALALFLILSLMLALLEVKDVMDKSSSSAAKHALSFGAVVAVVGVLLLVLESRTSKKRVQAIEEEAVSAKDSYGQFSEARRKKIDRELRWIEDNSPSDSRIHIEAERLREWKDDAFWHARDAQEKSLVVLVLAWENVIVNIERLSNDYTPTHYPSTVNAIMGGNQGALKFMLAQGKGGK